MIEVPNFTESGREKMQTDVSLDLVEADSSHLGVNLVNSPKRRAIGSMFYDSAGAYEYKPYRARKRRNKVRICH